jgi:hypothetical protein
MNLLKEGKTNWKYIFIVVISAIVVGGGILYYCLKFQRIESLPIKLSPRPEKEVTVTTDKTEYEYVGVPEGMVKLMVKNNLYKSICFESCNTYYLLKKKGGSWEELGTRLCEFITVTECIKPNEIKIFEYITIWKEKGTYKFAIPYVFEEDLKDFPSRYYEIIKTIYSNEFTIKE